MFETVVYMVFLSLSKQLLGYTILCFWWQINALKFSQMIAASLLTNNKFLEIQMRCMYSEIYSIIGGAWRNVCGAASVQRHKVQVVHLEHVLVSVEQGDLNPLTLVTAKNLRVWKLDPSYKLCLTGCFGDMHTKIH